MKILEVCARRASRLRCRSCGASYLPCKHVSPSTSSFFHFHSFCSTFCVGICVYCCEIDRGKLNENKYCLKKVEQRRVREQRGRRLAESSQRSNLYRVLGRFTSKGVIGSPYCMLRHRLLTFAAFPPDHSTESSRRSRRPLETLAI